MRRLYFFTTLCFLVLGTTFAQDNSSKKNESLSFSLQRNKSKGEKSEFTPRLNPLLGIVFRTSLQMAGEDASGKMGYNFQPGALKIGILGFRAYLTPTLSAVASFGVHANGNITDAFVHYKPIPYLDIKLGRLRGSGMRASHETAPYDVDLADYPYISEALAVAQGGADFRHFGIDIKGNYKWVKAGFFLHNNDSKRFVSVPWGSDTPNFNRGLALKSWDTSLSIKPIKQLEVGAHLGSINFPGMGNESKLAFSGFIYLIEPGVYKLKIDYGDYSRIDFFEKEADGTEKLVDPNYKDYSTKVSKATKKRGFSVFAAYSINKYFELAARFEYSDHAKIENERLTLYTVGVNYYIPKLSNRNKLTFFVQHRQEKIHSISNDLACLQYQFAL